MCRVCLIGHLLTPSPAALPPFPRFSPRLAPTLRLLNEEPHEDRKCHRGRPHGEERRSPAVRGAEETGDDLPDGDADALGTGHVGGRGGAAGQPGSGAAGSAGSAEREG